MVEKFYVLWSDFKLVNKVLKKFVNIPDNVDVNLNSEYVYFFGPMGKIKHKINKDIFIDIVNNKLNITLLDRKYTKKKFRKIYSLINTTVALLINCIHGVLYYFTRSLIIKGIGYKVEYNESKKILELFIGFSHSVTVDVPDDISVNILNNTEICICSVSKYKASQFAADIRAKRVIDVYKGNGIKYKDEIIILKSPKKSK